MSSADSKEYNEKIEISELESQGGGFTVLEKPTVVFDEAAEKALYRKMDLRVMPILALLYLLSFMDRGNIGNARLSFLERDLDMLGTTEYNVALSAYFLTYCFFEVPANLMLKYLRPSIWLSSIALAWGLVMTCMGFVQSYYGLVACRLMLGVTEAGLFPGVVLYLTFFYPRHMTQLRISEFFAAATMAGAFSGLLAYAISFMQDIGGYSAWRWIFILEGVATIAAGVLGFYAIVDSISAAKFLSIDEKAWLNWRKFSDQGKVGEAENITWAYISSALFNWQVWLSTGYYISAVVPVYSIGLFLPTIINSFAKYTRPQVQLLTVPVYVAACAWVILVAYYADKQKTRFKYVIVNQILCLIGFIINIAPSPQPLKYVGLIIAACGCYSLVPTTVTWLGNNLAGQTKRGIGMATQIGIGNLGALASSNIYRTIDSPTYYLGHGTVIGFLLLGICCSPLYAYLLTKENARRTILRAERDALPEDQRPVYSVKELRDQGDRSIDFVYTV